MQPGESAELTGLAKLGAIKETVRKNAAGAVAGVAASLVVGAVTGGAVAGAVVFSQREIYFVLTDRQLLFFEANQATGGPGKHFASFPRAAARARDLKTGVFVSFVLELGDNAPIKLTFPPIPPKVKRSGVALAKALTPVA